MLREHERWILSFYRDSEIQGARFFARLAQTLSTSPLQHDLTRHFADESQHAWYWSQCLDRLELEPASIGKTYQDGYLEAAGLPVNIMEILALTHVFEKRVVRQYTRHLQLAGVSDPVRETIDKIMADERWHLRWVHDAIEALKPEYGDQHVRDTLDRFEAADREVFAQQLHEHQDRLAEFRPDPERKAS